METSSRTLVLAANSAWNIAHFRAGLIRGLKQAGYRPIAIAPQDAMAGARLIELDIEHIHVPITRSGLNPIVDAALLLRYRRLLRQLRPAAFLGFTIKPNIYGSLASDSLGIPVIANVSGLGTAFIRSGPLQQLVSGLYRAAFRKPARVFFHNPDDRDLFIKRGIVGEEQARLLPGSGIDLAHFAAVPLPSGPIKFLMIARLLADKGVREYVDAARQLHRRALPDAKFQLLGPLDSANRTAISEAELRSWIDEGVIEYIPECTDVRPHIADAAVIVLPSYREGLPRTLLEAAAMARPLIATDVPGCREVVEHGINGFLCEVRNSTSLAKAMRQMAELPSKKRELMGKASRLRVQERFSEEHVVAAYLDVLAKLDAVRA